MCFLQYAEKAKQLASLCQTPDASCNEVYGLSLGRGTFTFAPGQWTNLRQTVRLNTPGVPDGGFALDVNGKRVMTLDSIYYRNVKSISSPTSSNTVAQSATPSSALSPIVTSAPSLWTASPPAPTIPPDVPPLPPTTDLPPLLGGLLSGLGGLLGSPETSTATPNGLFGRQQLHKADSGVARRRHQQQTPYHQVPLSGPVELIAPRSFRIDKQSGSPPYRRSRIPRARTRGDDDAMPVPFGQVAIAPVRNSDGNAGPPPVSSSSSSSAPIPLPSVTSGPLSPPIVLAADRPEAAFGFTGIFFSTFFGGHDPSWATPKDQYIWFKDFALIINN